MSKINKQEELWLWNLTNTDVVIPDLAALVPARKCINLYRVPYITKELILKSEKEGSLFKRKHILKYGGPPHFFANNILISQQPLQRPNKGGFTLVEEKNDTNDFSLEPRTSELEFVEQNLALEEESEESEELWKPKKNRLILKNI